MACSPSKLLKDHIMTTDYCVEADTKGSVVLKTGVRCVQASPQFTFWHLVLSMELTSLCLVTNHLTEKQLFTRFFSARGVLYLATLVADIDLLC